MDSISLIIKTILDASKKDIDQQILKLSKQLNTLKINPEIDTKSIQAMQTQIDKLNKVFKDNKPDFTPKFDSTVIEDKIKRINNSLDRLKVNKDAVFSNSGVSAEVNTLKEMETGFRNGAVSAKAYSLQMDNVRTKVAQVSGGLQNVNKDGYSFTQMVELAGKKIAIWGISTMLVYGSLRKLQEGIGYVSELNNQLTKLRIEMNLSDSDLVKMTSSAQSLAKELGSTVSNVLKVAEVYSNINETVDSIVEKTRAAIVLSNLSGMDTTSASDAIQAISLQFGLLDKDAMHISDVIAKTSAGVGIDFNKAVTTISDAVKVSGNVAQEAGISLERYSAIVSSIAERTRLPGSTLGQSMKTIITRTNRVTTDETSADDISKAETALRSVNIEVRKSLTEFKNFDDVMGELAKKWDTLTGTEKSYLSYQLSGIRQINVMEAMMKGWGKSTELTTDNLNAQGFAMEKNAIHMQSTEAKLKLLTASAETFWQKTISSDAINGLIGFGIELINIVDKVGLLNTAMIALVIFNQFKTIPLLTSLSSGVIQLGASFGLTAAQSSLAFGLIGVAAIALISIINQIATANQRYIESQKEIISQSDINTTKYNDEIDKLKRLKERLIEAGADKTKLIAIQKDFNDIIGKSPSLINGEAEAISIANQKIKDQIDIKTKLLQIEKDRKLDAEKAVFNSTKIKTGNFLSDWASGGGYNQQQAADMMKISDQSKGQKSWDYSFENFEQKSSRLKSELLKMAEMAQSIFADSINKNEQLNEVSKKAVFSFIDGMVLEGKSLDEINKSIDPFISDMQKISSLTEDFYKQVAQKDKVGAENSLTEISNILDTLKTKYPESTTSVDILSQALSTMAQNANNSGSATETLVKALDSVIPKMEDVDKTLKALPSDFNDLESALKELNKTHALSSDTQMKLVEQYPELLTYLGDENTLRTKLEELMQKDVDTFKQTLIDKLMGTESFYNEVLSGDQTLTNELKNAYGSDYNNFTTFSDLKLAANVLLLNTMGADWAKFYTSQAEALNSLSNVGVETFNEQGERTGVGSPSPSAAKAKALSDSLFAASKAVAIKVAKISLNSPILNGGDVSKTPKDTSASDAEKLRQEQIQKEFSDLKFNKDMGWLGKDEVSNEAEYYRRLVELRDKYFEKGTKDWQQYTLDIDGYNKRLIKDAEADKQAQIQQEIKNNKFNKDMGWKSEKEYIDKLILIRDKYFEKGSEDWRQHTLEIDAYNKKVIEEAQTKAESLAKSLATHKKTQAEAELKLIDENRKAAADASKKKIDDLNSENTAREKSIDLLKAEQELLNIGKEKNVRIINAQGQWENISDPRALRDAKENVDKLRNEASLEGKISGIEAKARKADRDYERQMKSKQLEADTWDKIISKIGTTAEDNITSVDQLNTGLGNLGLTIDSVSPALANLISALNGKPLTNPTFGSGISANIGSGVSIGSSIKPYGNLPTNLSRDSVTTNNNGTTIVLNGTIIKANNGNELVKSLQQYIPTKGGR